MQNLKRGPRLFLAPLLAFTLLLGACGSIPSLAPPGPVQGEYVGDVGTLAGFALSTDGRQVIAYLCDGDTLSVSISQWFKGAVTNNSIDLTNPQGSHLVATLAPDTITGTVTLKAGQPTSFTLRRIPDPGSLYGLYRSEETFNGNRYLGGWILTTADLVTAPLGAKVLMVSPLNPLMCCNPIDHGRGIVNEQTGALSTSPEPDYPNRQVAVPDLGTFRLTLCRQGAC